MHRLTGQGPESANFPHALPGPVTARSVSRLSDSELARYVASGAGNIVTATLTLTAACKQVVGLEILHCE